MRSFVRVLSSVLVCMLVVCLCGCAPKNLEPEIPPSEEPLHVATVYDAFGDQAQKFLYLRSNGEFLIVDISSTDGAPTEEGKITRWSELTGVITDWEDACADFYHYGDNDGNLDVVPAINIEELLELLKEEY